MFTSRWAPKPEDKAEEKPAEPAPPAQQTEAKVVDPPPPAETYAPPPPAAMPDDYDYADSAIDPFAQTAGTDDLFFDDDFTPVAEPVVEETPVEVAPTEPVDTAVPATAVPATGMGQSQYAPRGPANGDRGGRGRGRGGRGRGRGRGGNQTQEAREPKEKPAQEETNNGEAAAESAPATIEASSTPAPSTPAVPKEPKSVRGDRTLTGGTPRARLTEAEINAKLAAMKAKNEALVTAHARSEADAANFEAREAIAAQKNAERKKLLIERQKIDRQNRQQMMGERERNRQMKLKAVGGREWDLEKEGGFEGTGDERRRGAARGAHGGVAGVTRTVGDEYALQQEEGNTSTTRGRGRGRGGRGGRGGRVDHQDTAKNQEAQHPPSASDFPELPSASTGAAAKEAEAPKKLDFPIRTKTEDAKATEPERPGIKKQESFGLPSPMAGKSWADDD
ncbi:hypothetical protein PMIN06_003229 [Paraphaeosphaeria minitans]|uniref:Uncharacterized protein n=1 Tax=Paraphaeosphaeria minitans TaxID=565426 RepID=A0A9P6KKI6_9PLEO|nr:hypothetical protein PMIN01_12520 [Paraphaeosphaeria minitans]